MTMLIAAALTVLASSLAQAPPAAAPNLKIDVVAVDGKGAPVTDLRPGEFEVWISGFRVPIVDVFAMTPESSRRTVVLVLDDGTLGPTLMPRVREVARHFVEQLSPADRMAIVSLNEARPLELTDDRARLAAAIYDYHVLGFPFRP